jgi:hypothetical protein
MKINEVEIRTQETPADVLGRLNYQVEQWMVTGRVPCVEVLREIADRHYTSETPGLGAFTHGEILGDGTQILGEIRAITGGGQRHQMHAGELRGLHALAVYVEYRTGRATA